jgi:hypothetical protein
VRPPIAQQSRAINEMENLKLVETNSITGSSPLRANGSNTTHN